MKRLSLFAASIAVLAVLISGCGGSSSGSSTSASKAHTLTVSVQWPTTKSVRTKGRVIPAAATGVYIQVYHLNGSTADANTYATQWVAKPQTGDISLSNATFANLASGTYQVVVNAYPTQPQEATGSTPPSVAADGHTPDIALAEGVEQVFVSATGVSIGVTMASTLDHFRVAISDPANDNFGAAVVNTQTATSTPVPQGGSLVLSFSYPSTAGNGPAVWTAYDSNAVFSARGDKISLYNSGSASLTFTPEDAHNNLVMLAAPASSNGPLFAVNTGAALSFVPTLAANPLVGTLQVISGGSASNITVAYTDGTNDGFPGSTVTENFAGSVILTPAPAGDTITANVTNAPPLFDAASLALVENSNPPGFGGNYTTGVVPSGTPLSIPNVLDRTRPFTFTYTAYLATTGGAYIPVLQTPAAYNANDPFSLSGTLAPNLSQTAGVFSLPIDASQGTLPVTQLVSGYPQADPVGSQLQGQNSVIVNRGDTLTITSVAMQIYNPATGKNEAYVVPVTDLVCDGALGSVGLGPNQSASSASWVFATNAADNDVTTAVTDSIKFHFAISAPGGGGTVADTYSTWSGSGSGINTPGYGYYKVQILNYGGIGGNGGVRGKKG